MKRIDRRLAIKQFLLGLSGLSSGCGGGGSSDSDSGTITFSAGAPPSVSTSPSAPASPAPPASGSPSPPAVKDKPFTTIGFDAPTPEQISIYCPTTRTVDAATSVSVRYKPSASSTWLLAHPLLHVLPAEITAGAPVAVVDSFAGAIFDLLPATNYDVELTIKEPAQGDVVLTASRATRALPPAAGTPTKTITSTGNLQTTLNSLVPGDVLQHPA